MLIVLKSIFKEQKKWTIKKVCCWKNTKQFSLFTHKVIQNLMRLTLKRVRLLNQSLYLPPHSLLNWAWIYPKPCSLTLADSIPKATDKSNYFWRGCFWRAYHCVKCFCIRSYSGRYFPRSWTEYGEILHISPYSVRMRNNTDQNNSEYGHFLCSVFLIVGNRGMKMKFL